MNATGISGRIREINTRVIALVGRGELAAALPLAKRSLRLTGRCVGRETQGFSTSLNNLATVHYALGEYSAAAALYDQALALEQRLVGDTPDFATILNNVAELYVDIGDYARARSLAERALAINRRDLDQDHSHIAVSLRNLASIHMRLGEYNEAMHLAEEALMMYRRLADTDADDLAGALNTLGLVRKLKSDYRGAEQLYQDALAALGEKGSPVVRAKCLANLADLYESIGDFAKAETQSVALVQHAERTYKPDHPEVAVALNNLGYLYHSMGRYDESVLCHQRALAIRQRLDKRHPEVASSLNNLARVKFDTGHFAEAIQLYREVLAIRTETLPATHPHIAQSLNNLGMAYLATGTYAEGLPLLEEALARRRALYPDGHPDVAETLVNLSVCLAASDRAASALELLIEAARHDERTIEQVFAFANEAQRLEYALRMRKYFYVFLSLAAGSLRGSRAAVQAACDLALRRKAITAEALAVQTDVVLRGRYPELAEKLRELTSLRAQIAEKTINAPDANRAEEARLLATWRDEAEKLESALARGIPEMALSNRMRHANSETVAAALASDTVLVDFVRFHLFDFHAVPADGEQQWSGTRYLAVVIPRGPADDIRLIDLGDSNAIDRMTNRFLAAASREAGDRAAPPQPAGESRQLAADIETLADEDGFEAGCELRRALFDPLTASFGHRTQLILSPEWSLCRLPFEALPTDDGRALVDIYQISYVSAGRDVLRFGARTTAAVSPPLVIADPDFDLAGEATDVDTRPPPTVGVSGEIRRGSPLFKRLSGTRREGERVGALLRVDALMDRRALKAHLKSARSPCILHLATHGFFLADNADAGPHPIDSTDGAVGDRLSRLRHAGNPLLRSGLALAGVNAWLRNRPSYPGADDGLLTAADVASLDLAQTELAVLSACDTGLGQIQIGEGVFGLRRAFVLAGVRTLIVSLWKVPDDQTQELMVGFYRLAGKDMPVAEALRAAQRDLKKNYRDTKYWGAFICQGDPGPLSVRTRNAVAGE